MGDEEDDVKQLNNSWTSVFVADGWRFVFPLWACRAVVGHSTGAYTKVETKGELSTGKGKYDYFVRFSLILYLL